MARSHTRTIVTALAGMATAIATVGIAQPASAASTPLAQCLAANATIENYACFEVTKLPGTATKGQVRVAWQVTDAAAALWTSYRGGIWLSRAPIAGQQTGTSTAYPNPDSDNTCQSPGFQGCFATFSGKSGSIVLDFPMSMAGYQYIIFAPDQGVDADGNLAEGEALEQDSNDTVVWLNKAYRYNAGGRQVTSLRCPSKKKNACRSVVNLVLNQNPGGGMPVSP